MNTMKVAGVTLIDDDRICKSIKQGKAFEPSTLVAWESLCDAPGWMVDIGAYSGLFSIIAAKQGCNAMAVEPLVEMQERITANAELNKVSVLIIPAAATKVSGSMIGIGVNDKVHLTSGASVLRKSNQRSVQSWKVDDILTGPGDLPIRAIKIDVERHEIAVLEGGMRVLRLHKPVLIVEALDDAAKRAVVKLLRPIGYEQVLVMDERNLMLQWC